MYTVAGRRTGTDHSKIDFLRITWSIKLGVVSESICDVVNAILFNNDWDPKTLYAPYPELVPQNEPMDIKTPFGIGKEFIVDVPVSAGGIADIYIDDTVGPTIELPYLDNNTH
eukprot:7097400-Ditylum_brightwellii.AAC.1